MIFQEVYCPASVKKQLAKEFEESLRITVPDEPDVVPSIDPCAANKAGIKFADYQWLVMCELRYAFRVLI